MRRSCPAESRRSLSGIRRLPTPNLEHPTGNHQEANDRPPSKLDVYTRPPAGQAPQNANTPDQHQRRPNQHAPKECDRTEKDPQGPDDPTNHHAEPNRDHHEQRHLSGSDRQQQQRDEEILPVESLPSGVDLPPKPGRLLAKLAVATRSLGIRLLGSGRPRSNLTPRPTREPPRAPASGPCPPTSGRPRRP